MIIPSSFLLSGFLWIEIEQQFMHGVKLIQLLGSHFAFSDILNQKSPRVMLGLELKKGE